ncbi:MAG: hypothetical protein JW957_03440 [Candidatus Omnitrophica bacterium]|nr:hypothetical protein [Candidatus Omnitrophota bacterium]
MKFPLRIIFLLISAAVISASPVRGAEDKRPTIDTLEQALVEQQIWLNNNIGITDKVPAPWTPINLKRLSEKRLTVEVLGRSYKFEKSIFPSAINIWGRQVLSQPIIVSAVSGGRKIAFPLNEVRVMKNNFNEIEIVSSGTARGIEIVAIHNIEYDGMIWTKLFISPLSSPVNVENLSLQISIKKEYSKYLNYFRCFNPPKEPDIFGVMKKLPFKSAFEPVLWMGNEDIGLCWFAESDRGWDRSGNLESQMEIFERGESRVMKFNFINNSRIIEKSREIVFGIIATPAKQVKENWRTIPALYRPDFFDFSWDGGVYYPGPDPKKVESGRFYEHLKSPSSYFKTSIQYHADVYPDKTTLPEHYLFGSLWKRITVREKHLLENPVPPSVRGGATVGSPASSMTDWLLWKWEKLVNTYGMKNIYFDGLGWTDINRLHGCGYIDENGILRPTIPILSSRNALKRFYVMMSEKTEDFNLFIHGFLTVPPLLSFVHAQLSGEQFIIDPRRVGRHYSEILPEEELKGYFMGKQFGVVGVFLPELPGRYYALQEPTTEMMMLLLLHNISVCPAFCNVGIVKAINNVMTDYGMESMEFIPYWDNAGYLTGSDEKVKVSLFLGSNPKDKKLLVIGNTNREPQMAKISLNDTLISGPLMIGKDLLNGESFRIEKGAFNLSVRELDFRLVAVSKGDQE